MAHICSRLNYFLLVWETLISQAETNKIKVLQNACIRIFTNGRFRQPILSMYNLIKSISFVEMVKLMNKYKKGLLPVPIKMYSYQTQIDQPHEIFLFSSTEDMSCSYTIIVS